jgi:hypothetical protein
MNYFMKKAILTIGLFAGIGCISINQSEAQVNVGLNINIGNQPYWGPVGYNYVNYYYLPDIDVYYCVPQRQFVYLQGNRWVFATSLPGRYHSYDLDRGYKVVINDNRPYLRDDIYRNRYRNYRGRYGNQSIIRDSDDSRYYTVKGNKHYDEHHDNGKHKGWYKDRRD